MGLLQTSFEKKSLPDLDFEVNKFGEEHMVSATQSYCYTNQNGVPTHVRVLFYLKPKTGE